MSIQCELQKEENIPIVGEKLIFFFFFFSQPNRESIPDKKRVGFTLFCMLHDVNRCEYHYKTATTARYHVYYHKEAAIDLMME